MPSLEIIKPGLMTSVQDLGRIGMAYYAIPHSGVMDKNAAKIANLLLNKKEECALIECTSSAPQIQFNDSTQIAISGANFNWEINGEPILRNSIIPIKKGDVLKGHHSKDGLRGYIAIKGHLKIDKVYRSYSTYMNAGIGGYKGRLLKKGDLIEWTTYSTALENEKIIPIKPGPEYEFLSEASKNILDKNLYKIGMDSNRMGIRLKGPKLSCSIHQLENSLPVLPGFIQLPPSGLPIVVLQDGQVTGGYPRIAYVPSRFLSELNQIPLGGGFRFELR